MPARSCLICTSTAAHATGPDTEMKVRFECPTCGSFDASTFLVHIWDQYRGTHEAKLEPEMEELLPYLSSAARRAATRLSLTTDNWVEFAESQRGRPLPEKINTMLDLLAKGASAPGEWIALTDQSLRALLSAKDVVEVNFILGHLLREALIEIDLETGTQPRYRLSMKGWQSVYPAGAGVPGTCFVAMSFDPSLDDAYENGIVPAIEASGFHVVRIDRVHHNDSITDKIIAGIRSAQFVVADFTLQRQGVYYEAGFALGLGRSVVWCCRDDDKDNLHFDTRQFNHVLWLTPTDLRTKLSDRIRATIFGAKPASVDI